MTEFAPAVRTNTAIVLALAGASGSGKTKSALELAVGLAGERGQILMIDSEGSRGLHYADDYRFFHHPWEPPYAPEELGKLLREAERRFAVVIVDSASDEYEGEGGLCDMKDAEVATQRKNGWEINDASAWARPKAAHKRHLIRWLRNARCHVILCLRADEKVRFEKEWKNGKERTVVVPIGWQAIAEKRLLYDVTTSMMFVPWTNTKEPDPRGKPTPIKLYDKHAPFFPLDRVVTREAGKKLAEWASGTAPLRPVEVDALSDASPLGETDALRAELNATAEEIARQGTKELRWWWEHGLTKSERKMLGSFLARYQGMAQEADEGAPT